jgi:hypothetical protein
MENCRFLRNIYAKQLANEMLQKPLTMDHGMTVMTTMMTNRIEILVTNMSIPPKLSTPSLVARCV